MKVILALLLLSLTLVSASTKLFTNVNSDAACCGSSKTFLQSTQYCCSGSVGTISTNDQVGNCCGNRLLRTNEICCENRPVSDPNGRGCCGSSVLPADRECCSDLSTSNDRTFDPTNQQCCPDGSVISISRTCCGSSGIDADQTCCGGSGIDSDRLCCGDEFVGRAYNPSSQTCCSLQVQDGVTTTLKVVIASGLGSCCGLQSSTLGTNDICCPDALNPNAKIQRNSGTKDCCGSGLYDTINQVCCRNDTSDATVGFPETIPTNQPGVSTCCVTNKGAVLYDPSTEICCNEDFSRSATKTDLSVREGIIACCNGKGYDPAYQTCCEGNIVCGDRCCDEKGYWSTSEVCCGGDVYQNNNVSGNIFCCDQKTPYNNLDTICCEDVLYSRIYGDTGECCRDFYYNRANRICCAPNSNSNSNSVGDILSTDSDDLSVLKSKSSKDKSNIEGDEYVRCGDTCCGSNGYFINFETCCQGKVYETDPNQGFACCGSSIFDNLSGVNLCCCDVADELTSSCSPQPSF